MAPPSLVGVLRRTLLLTSLLFLTASTEVHGVVITTTNTTTASAVVELEESVSASGEPTAPPAGAIGETGASFSASSEATSSNNSNSNSNNPKPNPVAIPALKRHSTVYKSTQSAAGFMFDMKAKKTLSIFGIDANIVKSSSFRTNDDGGERRQQPPRVLVYTKPGSYRGYEKDKSAWTLWMDARLLAAKEDGGANNRGRDEPTSLPQRSQDVVDPIAVTAGERRSFYVTFLDGPYLRYGNSDEEEKEEEGKGAVEDGKDNNDGGDGNGNEKLYYVNWDMVLYARGAAKRRGWDGTALSPRAFNGGLHYRLGDAETDPLPTGVQLLPDGILSMSPTGRPTVVPTERPSASMVPSESNAPTMRPTMSPTLRPTASPTPSPTQSPVDMEAAMTALEGAESRPVLVYAGSMFDVKGRNDVEIRELGFNTYLTREMDVALYVREGGYEGAEVDIKQWTWVANVTVTGQGMGNPTYLPEGSFEPILLRKSARMGFYIATDGPYIRATKGDKEGKPHAANADVVFYQGVGKRHPMESGTIRPRMFNGVLRYHKVVIPTTSPTIDARDLFVRNVTLTPVQDTYIQKGVKGTTFGKKAQLKVDGTPESIALMEFDMSKLNGGTKDEPTQVLSAVLRMYAMTKSDHGGEVGIVPDGWIDEDKETWDNCPYASAESATSLGRFRSVWPDKFYEMDVTEAFREKGSIPKSFVIRISSDADDGVMYRSSAGGGENGPRLLVTFAYDPDSNQALAREFGSDPPTSTPTAKPTTPEWDDARTPKNPGRSYFNYNPNSGYGPDRWYRIAPDGYYDRLKKLKTDTSRNRCRDGRRQSPRDLCRTSDDCLEFHETRMRRGEYGLGTRDETKARPTPHIMHNKLRLSYRERRSEFEEPIPPGADFARNGMNSGTQDLIHMDLKVRSEHRLCGKQYDAEMQLYYLHNYGNLEANAVLINADGEKNDHFQIMLDFFQNKFDTDKGLCERKQRRARALASGVGRNRRLRKGSASLSEEEVVDGPITDDELEVKTENFAEPEPPSSLGDAVYQKIQTRFLSLVQRRQVKELRWDPLKPWDVLKSVHFWSYSGSTTEPPCFEDVKWRIVDVPMTISHPQLVQLKQLMFDHVDPVTCAKTSTHRDESNARPVQPYRGGAVYRCRRSDYASDAEREASGRRKGFVLKKKWRGVDMFPWVDPEFPNV